VSRRRHPARANDDGHTLFPDLDGPGEIYLNPDLEGKKLMVIALHEALHCALGKLAAEEWVEKTAEEFARFLWRLGFKQLQ
jgi:hypothetical protein